MCPRYDIVVIDDNKDKVMSLQRGHGGWKSCLVSVSHCIPLWLLQIMLPDVLIWNCANK